jgi:LmbE family N-acetylglucosaminyl deacetylase
MGSPDPLAPCSLPWAGSRRILILVPHPDDEVVGCCAAIGRARAAGAEVFGHVLTTGVPAREVLWPWERSRHQARVARRLAECRSVAAMRGFSGMECSSLPTRQLRTALLDVRRQVLSLLGRLRIDTVWAPAYEGAHTDHDSASVLAASLTEEPQRADVAVYEYAEYNFGGGRVNSQTFLQTQGTESVLLLTPEEARFKRQALAAYHSAQADLGYVGTARESFRPLWAYDYANPPHPGKLFYQRFQWVLFRHPRIDFTQPHEACRDFANFRKALAG